MKLKHVFLLTMATVFGLASRCLADPTDPTLPLRGPLDSTGSTRISRPDASVPAASPNNANWGAPVLDTDLHPRSITIEKTTVISPQETPKASQPPQDKEHHSIVGATLAPAKAGVGLTDRAAKTTVGLPYKAVKETFKAIF